MKAGRGKPGRALYIMYSETAVTEPVFKPRGYASQGGRMDVVASSILAAQLDPQPRFNAVLMGPPSPTKILRVNRWGFASERQVVNEILAAFKGRSSMIEIRSGSPLDPLNTCRRCRIIMLEESGRDIALEGEDICGDVAFILGGHLGFPQNVYRDLVKASHSRVSIGPVSLQTYQAILYLAWRRASICGARPAAGNRSTPRLEPGIPLGVGSSSGPHRRES